MPLESEGWDPRRQAWGREPLSLGKASLPQYFHRVQRGSALAVSELAPCPPFFGEELAGNGIRIGHDGFDLILFRLEQLYLLVSAKIS